MRKKFHAYKTLKELQRAYESGALNRDESPLRIDNDCSFVYRGDECVFRSDCPPQADLLEEALKMLGIPSESA